MSGHGESGGSHGGHDKEMSRREFLEFLTFGAIGIFKAMTSPMKLVEGVSKIALMFSGFLGAPFRRGGGGGGGGHKGGHGHGH
jgi:hypothetical protein